MCDSVSDRARRLFSNATTIDSTVKYWKLQREHRFHWNGVDKHTNVTSKQQQQRMYVFECV